MARNAVATPTSTRVSDEQLLKEPRLQPLRKELLSLALDYYLGFIKDRANDPNVRKELADALHTCPVDSSTLGFTRVPTRS